MNQGDILTSIEEIQKFIRENDIKHFNPQEFVCKHCGEVKIHPKLIVLAEELREILGKPLVITSGYRCPEHNRAVGGVPDSAHTKGLALDVACVSSRTRFVILSFLFRAGVRRIGVAKNYIHFDIDDSKPQGVVWHYYG